MRPWEPPIAHSTSMCTGAELTPPVLAVPPIACAMAEGASGLRDLVLTR